MNNRIFKLTTLAIATSLLAACGGGGGGGSSKPGFNSKEISGVAVDFYLAGADVDFTNSNCEAAYPDLKTDENGKFTFKTTPNCQETGFTIKGGIDTVTKLPFTGQLKVKEINYQAASTTEIVASPLTTLQAELPANFEQVLTNLGFSLNEDVTTFDPVTDGSNEQLAAVFVLQQILNQLENSGLTISEAVQVVQAAAEDTQLLTNSGVDSNMVTAVFNAAIASTTDTNVQQALAASQTNVVAVTTIINTALTSTSSSSNLEDYLTDNSTIIAEIQDSLVSASYNDLSFAGYSIQEITNSQSGFPLSIDKNSIDSLAKVKFTLNDSVIATDSMKLGFKANAAIGQNGQLETLTAYISDVKVSFNDSTANSNMRCDSLKSLMIINKLSKFL
ncbi:membrane associated precursor, exported and processed into extracellular protein exp [Acinetobacter sp. HA]|uniref:hypothetical protein n=1 Tax=Acinetobacter sp. HA TaxID=1173062 RepID=UPI000263DF7B|nr:hypothetical protein [Acinetobacter sp. HA]EIM39920.1 membrane associated precursor, exported and processed into extracellular protein exp [Acinetobacter sp. HA]